VHVVAHSYGSLVAARLCRLHPKAVSSLALMDPVCFGMFMPALLRTFLYSFPSSGHPILDLGL
jgi:pimeloyl-ACP methyl ester carboxylesterase